MNDVPMLWLCLDCGAVLCFNADKHRCTPPHESDGSESDPTVLSMESTAWAKNDPD